MHTCGQEDFHQIWPIGATHCPEQPKLGKLPVSATRRGSTPCRNLAACARRPARRGATWVFLSCVRATRRALGKESLGNLLCTLQRHETAQSRAASCTHKAGVRPKHRRSRLTLGLGLHQVSGFCGAFGPNLGLWSSQRLGFSSSEIRGRLGLRVWNGVDQELGPRPEQVWTWPQTACAAASTQLVPEG